MARTEFERFTSRSDSGTGCLAPWSWASLHTGYRPTRGLLEICGSTQIGGWEARIISKGGEQLVCQLLLTARISVEGEHCTPRKDTSRASFGYRLAPFQTQSERTCPRCCLELRHTYFWSSSPRLVPCRPDPAAEAAAERQTKEVAAPLPGLGERRARRPVSQLW